MMKLIGNCWPNEEQLLLLKAALAEPKLALESWEKWTKLINIDDVDVFSYQIMPQIFCHLSQTKKQFSHQGILKGIYKHTWMNNQILMNHLSQLLARYNYCTDKPILLMKGGAMLQGFYQHWGCRVIGDFDLLVPQEELRPFINFLLTEGLSSEDMSSVIKLTDDNWQLSKNSIPFQDKNCERPFFLDLHITPLSEMLIHHRPAPIWFNQYKTHVYQGQSIHTLDTSDLFFQTIIHGTKYSPVPLFRWIMDAVVILTKASNEINWESIFIQSQQYELVLQMQQALLFLKNTFDCNIPEHAMTKIQELYVTRFNLQEFTQKSKKSSSFRQVISHHRFHAKRQKKNILQFLKDYWHLQYYYQIPLAALTKSYKFFKRKWSYVN